jgi:signal transduction histidine kinase
VRNLLSNAVKYSHPGGKIRIEMHEKGGFVHVRVSDEGIGMPEEQLARLFKIEYKESIPGTEKERGTGLGLILCKEFIEKCGGSIAAESEEGKGSTFSFALPASKA